MELTALVRDDENKRSQLWRMAMKKHAAVVAVVGIVLGLGGAARADLLTDLEGYWRLDEASGLVAADSSTHGSDGNLTGDPVWQPGTGVLNGSLNFDASGDVVTVPWDGGAGIDILNKSFSVSFWTKRDGTGAEYVLGQGDTGATRQSLHIGFRDADTLTFAFYGDDLNYDNAVVIGDVTNWHHWVCTYDMATGVRSVYLDGNTTPVATNTAGGAFTGSGTNDFWIGRRIGNWNFVGNIDEVGVWSDRVLTGAEAAQLFNGGAGLDFFIQPGDELVWDACFGNWGDLTDPSHPGESHWLGAGPTDIPEITGGVADTAIIDDGEVIVAADQGALSVTMSGLALVTIEPTKTLTIMQRTNIDDPADLIIYGTLDTNSIGPSAVGVGAGAVTIGDGGRLKTTNGDLGLVQGEGGTATFEIKGLLTVASYDDNGLDGTVVNWTARWSKKVTVSWTCRPSA